MLIIKHAHALHVYIYNLQRAIVIVFRIHSVRQLLFLSIDLARKTALEATCMIVKEERYISVRVCIFGGDGIEQIHNYLYKHIFR